MTSSCSSLVLRGVRTALAALLTASLAPAAYAAGARFDFDADGRADLFWRRPDTGAHLLWLLDGAGLAAQGAVDAQADLAWRLEAIDDFDGDARADLLWRNVETGRNEIWRMNAFAVLARVALPTLRDDDWHVAATGDLDGDGRADVVWRHEAFGTHALWRMGASGPQLPATVLPSRGLAWRIASAADFDGDGRADLLWRERDSGANEACLTTAPGSFACTSLPALFPLIWQLEAVADFDGDHKADVLWRESGQDLRLWTMHGAAVQSEALVSFERTARLLLVGDVNGDARADLVFRHVPQPRGDPKDALLHVWLMSGPTPSAVGDLAPPAQAQWAPGPQPAPVPVWADVPPDVPTRLGDAVRFVEQISFGASPALVARTLQLGFASVLEEQLAAPASQFYDFVSSAPTTNDSARVNALRTRFFMNALAGEDQLRQRVALALSQILVVSTNDVFDGPGMARYADLLVQHAFGNYRQLLHDVTLSPAMGNYLDMVNNDKPNPITGRQANENYARELMQLFSIGLVRLNANGTPQRGPDGNPLASYSQDDVEGLARVFTGWTYAPLPGQTPQAHNPTNYLAPMVLWAPNHDTGQKVILDGVVLPAGQSGEQDLNAALDTIFDHPSVGPFVARQLIQHLVTSNPSRGYVARVSAAFDGLGGTPRGDLKATLRALLLDPEARRDPGNDASFGRLREPLQFIPGLLRTLATGGQGYGLVSYASNMAQSPQGAPSVFNFFLPGYRLPGTSLAAPPFQIYSESTAARRANFVNTLIYGTVPVPSYAPTGSTTVVVDFAPWIALAGDPQALVDTLDARFTGGRLPTHVRDALLAAVTATASTSPTNRAKTALYLLATSPHYQVQR